MSPAEFWIELEAAGKRADDDRRRDLIQAWQIESIALHVRAKKKMPDLAQLLEGKGRAQRQTVRQQRSMLEMLSEQSGIPLRQAGGKGQPAAGRKRGQK